MQSINLQAAQSYGGDPVGGLGSDLKWQFGKNGGGGGYGTLSGGGGNGPAPVFPSNYTFLGVGGVALSTFWDILPDMMKNQVLTDFNSYEIHQGAKRADNAHTNEMRAMLDNIIFGGYGMHGNMTEGYTFDNRYVSATSTKSNEQEAYQFSDGMGQVLNAAGVMYGGSEVGLNVLGKYGNSLGKFFGGAGQVAKGLNGTLGVLSKTGKVLGVAGYALSTVSIGAKVITGQHISTAEKVGFGVSTVLTGAGVFVAGAAAGTAAAAAAAFIAAGALIYGTIELGSFIFTGNTAEENFFGKN